MEDIISKSHNHIYHEVDKQREKNIWGALRAPALVISSVVLTITMILIVMAILQLSGIHTGTEALFNNIPLSQ